MVCNIKGITSYISMANLQLFGFLIVHRLLYTLFASCQLFASSYLRSPRFRPTHFQDMDMSLSSPVVMMHVLFFNTRPTAFMDMSLSSPLVIMHVVFLNTRPTAFIGL